MGIANIEQRIASELILKMYTLKFEHYDKVYLLNSYTSDYSEELYSKYDGNIEQYIYSKPVITEFFELLKAEVINPSKMTLVDSISLLIDQTNDLTEQKELALHNLRIAQIYVYMSQIMANVKGSDNPFFNLKAG